MDIESLIESIILDNKNQLLGILYLLIDICLVLNFPKMLMLLFNKKDYILGNWRKAIEISSIIGVIVFPIGEVFLLAIIMLSYGSGILMVFFGLVK